MPSDLARHFLLDPAFAFLNHGSYGACPRPVMDAYRAWQAQLERQPVAFMEPAHLAERFAEVARALGAALGADADDLAWVTNATAGLNVIARSLGLMPGDEVLTTDHEYAALEKTWTFVAAQTGAVIRTVAVPLPLTAGTFTDAIRAAMTGRTRVLFLSHVTSPTALVFPLAGIVAEARARGIVTVIDGAHAPGHVPLDLNALGADYYVGNCHKWLMAPKGTAFLHARRDRQEALVPQVISHGWTEDRSASGPFGGTAFQDAFRFQGTRDPAAWLSVPAALMFRAEQDWPAVSAACHRLAWEIAGDVSTVTGLAPIATPDTSAPQMIALPLPDCDTAALHRDLRARCVEIPCYRWKRKPFARLSVQGYNGADDGARLVAELARLLR